MLALWPVLPVVVASGLATAAFDVVSTFQVGQLDEAETHRYFALAASWLRGWKAPVGRVLAFGFVNPRQIVAK